MGVIEAEDLVHTVCARFLRDGVALDNIGAWVTSLQREAIDRTRSAHSRYTPRMGRLYDDDGDTSWFDAQKSHSVDMAAMLDLARLCDKIDALPARDRSILAAFANQDTWDDIEKNLGIHRETLAERRRALKKLLVPA